MAIASLVLGILGLVGTLPLIGSLLAVIFGRIALRKVDRGEATERGLAQWGFWLGVAGLIIIGLVIIVVAIILVVVGIAAMGTAATA